jgi:predicted cobalt transporter CbtA
MKESNMGEGINTGLIATIVVFVLAAVFGIVLWFDAKKAMKSEKAETKISTPAPAPSAAEVTPPRDSWKDSAERFKKFARKDDSQTEA